MSKARLVWIDAARMAAITGVVLVHTTMLSPGLAPLVRDLLSLGQYGVQIFFSISAILIAKSMASVEWSRVGRWLYRRYLRIAPLYYYGIVLYTVLNILFIAIRHPRGDPEIGVAEIVANFFLVHSLVPSANNSVVPGGWSISVEIFFYLLFPLIKFTFRNTLGYFMLFCASVALSLFVHSYVWPVEINRYQYYYPVTQLPVFFWGVFIYNTGPAAFFGEPQKRQSFPLPRILNLLLALFLGCVIAFDAGKYAVLMPLIAGALGVEIMIGMRTMRLSAFVQRAIYFIGGHSYSIYINHFFCLWALSFLMQALGLKAHLNGYVYLTVLFTATYVAAAFVSVFTKKHIEDRFFS